MTEIRSEHEVAGDIVDAGEAIVEDQPTPEPKPSTGELWSVWRAERKQRRAERKQRLAQMSDYERWRRNLKVRRTVGVLLILAIIGGIAYVIFFTNIGARASTAAQPALALLAEVREDPRKAYVALGALLAGKIGLIFLIEDLFSPNSRR